MKKHLKKAEAKTPAKFLLAMRSEKTHICPKHDHTEKSQTRENLLERSFLVNWVDVTNIMAYG
jgi:hypothetical protein